MRPQPKPSRKRDPKYLEWIRKQKCLTCTYRNPNDIYRVDAHHVPLKGHGKTGSKTDRRTVPLCSHAHDYYNDLGRARFEADHDIDLEAEIKRLNQEYDALNIKPTRAKKPVLKLTEYRVLCDCGREHVLPSGKAEVIFISWRECFALKYNCVTRNERREVVL